MRPAVKKLMLDSMGLRSLTQLPGLELWLSTKDAADIMVGGGTASIWHDISGKSSTNCLILSGVAGNYASSPHSAALAITGSIAVVAKMSSDDWGSVDNLAIAGKLKDTNNRSWFFEKSSTGTLRFTTSSDGTVGTQIAHLASAGITFGDMLMGWVRADRNVNDGGATTTKFYTSDDGSAWTQLGTPQTTAGTSSLFNATIAALEIGSLVDGTSEMLKGRIERLQVWSGAYSSGTLVFDANVATASRGATSFVESSANAATVTVNTTGATGLRISGARDAYQGTAANQLAWDAVARTLT